MRVEARCINTEEGPVLDAATPEVGAERKVEKEVIQEVDQEAVQEAVQEAFKKQIKKRIKRHNRLVTLLDRTSTL